jgi:hypothetical protein
LIVVTRDLLEEHIQFLKAYSQAVADVLKTLKEVRASKMEASRKAAFVEEAQLKVDLLKEYKAAITYLGHALTDASMMRGTDTPDSARPGAEDGVEEETVTMEDVEPPTPKARSKSRSKSRPPKARSKSRSKSRSAKQASKSNSEGEFFSIEDEDEEDESSHESVSSKSKSRSKSRSASSHGNSAKVDDADLKSPSRDSKSHTVSSESVDNGDYFDQVPSDSDDDNADLPPVHSPRSRSPNSKRRPESKSRSKSKSASKSKSKSASRSNSSSKTEEAAVPTDEELRQAGIRARHAAMKEIFKDLREEAKRRREAGIVPTEEEIRAHRRRLEEEAEEEEREERARAARRGGSIPAPPPPDPSESSSSSKARSKSKSKSKSRSQSKSKSKSRSKSRSQKDETSEDVVVEDVGYDSPPAAAIPTPAKKSKAYVEEPTYMTEEDEEEAPVKPRRTWQRQPNPKPDPSSSSEDIWDPSMGEAFRHLFKKKKKTPKAKSSSSSSKGKAANPLPEPRIRMPIYDTAEDDDFLEDLLRAEKEREAQPPPDIPMPDDYRK